MYYASRKPKEQRSILEDNVAYPQASVKEYLNIKRVTKDKCCLVFFCAYMMAVIMITGIGFFYANFVNIGSTISLQRGTNSTYVVNQANCPYINEQLQCLTACPTGELPYLQKVCIAKNYTPNFSQELKSQVQIYSLYEMFGPMLYINVGIVIGLIVLFLLLVCYQALIYLYIVSMFVSLLALAFYMLKSIEIRVSHWNDALNVYTGIFIDKEQSLNGLAFTLLAGYLIIFPIVLFSPKKIRIAMTILGNIYKFFESMYSILAFTVLLTLICYILIFLFSFLLMNFFTGGNAVINSNSFFYGYEKIKLSHPAALVFFFFGVYWLFGTINCWHKYLIGSAMLQWYFQDGGKLNPVSKGLRRAWYHLGSAAFDSLLSPFQWILLLLYSICKLDNQSIQEYENQNHEDCLCCSNILYSFRNFITRLYLKMNRNCASSGVLTNHTYIQSCEIAAVTFAHNKHRFFNIGGNLTIFLTIFSILIFLLVNYISLFKIIIDTSYPSRVSSLSLCLAISFFLGLTTGLLMSNIYSCSVDCLLFCYLLQKKNGIQQSQNEIKKIIDDINNKQEEVQPVLEMYEIQEDYQ